MLVYKIWWPNCDKQLWERRGEHEKEKKQRLVKVSQLFLAETVANKGEKENLELTEVHGEDWIIIL